MVETQLENVFPHRAGPMSQGTVSTGRMELICPWHRFRFDLRTGASLTNPELVNETYPVAVENGDVFVGIRRNAAPDTGAQAS